MTFRRQSWSSTQKASSIPRGFIPRYQQCRNGPWSMQLHSKNLFLYSVIKRKAFHMFAYYISPSETNKHLWSFILMFFSSMIALPDMRFQGSVDWWEGLTHPSTNNLQSSSGLQEVLGGEKWCSSGKMMMSLMMIHGLKSTKDVVVFGCRFPKRVAPKTFPLDHCCIIQKVYIYIYMLHPYRSGWFHMRAQLRWCWWPWRVADIVIFGCLACIGSFIVGLCKFQAFQVD